MGTHLLGQAQVVADSIPTNQGDGASESPNSQRIRESAYRAAGIAIHSTRWVEGLVRMMITDIGELTDRELDAFVGPALKAVEALPATELDEIAQKAGL